MYKRPRPHKLAYACLLAFVTIISRLFCSAMHQQRNKITYMILKIIRFQLLLCLLLGLNHEEQYTECDYLMWL